MSGVARWLDDHRSPVVGTVTAVAVFVAIAWSSRDVLSMDVASWGDSAANSLLVDDALRGRLLVGHYSRFRFNHPGPVFLYVQAGGELLFHRWLGWSDSAFGGWLLGLGALNAALIGWTAAVAARWTRSVTSAVVLVGLTLGMSAWVPALFAKDWAPALIVAPFLLMAVSGIFVAAGRYGALTPLVTAMCILVHGHLSAIPFVAGTAAVIVAVHWVRRRRDPERWTRPTRREWLPGAIVAAVFATPILIHTLTDWPGELRGYAALTRGRAGITSGSVSEVGEFVWSAVVHGPLHLVVLVVSIGFLTACLTILTSERRRDLVAGVLVLVVLAGLFVLYAWRTVDDLSLDYLGWFGFVLPTVLVWLAVTEALAQVRDRFGAWQPPVAAAVAIVAVFAAALPSAEIAPTTAGMPVVAELVDALGDEPSRLVFEHDDWPVAVGVVAEAFRADVEVCVEDESWAFMVTEDRVCDPDSSAREVVLSQEGAAADPPAPARELFRGSGYLLTESSVPE